MELTILTIRLDDHKKGHPPPVQEGDDTGNSQSSRYRSMSMSSDSTLSSVSHHSSISCAFPLRTVEQREVAVNAAVGNTEIESTEQTGNDAPKDFVLVCWLTSGGFAFTNGSPEREWIDYNTRSLPEPYTYCLREL